MTERTPDEAYASIRERFRDDYEFAIGPLRDGQRANFDAALKFADGGIKALFGLNGGGLIALPAFTALFKIDMQAAASLVLAAGIIFVIGLVLAASTCLLGYLSAMQEMEAGSHRQTAAATRYATHYRQVPETPAAIEGIKSADARAARHTTWSIWLRKAAVATAICSLAAFIGAACITGTS